MHIYRRHPERLPHTFVSGLGEGAHGNHQGHLFRLSLIRDPRFAATVNDLVVEFGSARYQNVIDRFVRGEDVDNERLRQVWQDTTQPQPAWDAPMYEEFFRAVRAVNATLPPPRQLRVALGDPPIDWDAVHTREDLRKWAGRGRHAAGVIEREVLERHRRALIIYGDAHLFRIPASETIVSLLESTPGISVFTVASPISMPASADLQSLQPDIATWSAPSLSILRGTALGAAEFAFYYPPPKVMREGKPVVAPLPPPWRSLRMEDQFDALLYLGPPSTITMEDMAPQLCADARYMEMRRRRMSIAAAAAQIERLERYCSGARKQ
jgi:hypothetical protein